MTRRLLIESVGGVAFLALALVVSGPARAEDHEKMQGTWKAVSAHAAGREASKDELKGIEVTVEKDKFTLLEGSRKEVVSFVLHPDLKPHHIDFLKIGSKSEKVWHGIYEFDGKELKLCWGLAGDDRPKEFGANKRNDHRYLIVRKK